MLEKILWIWSYYRRYIYVLAVLIFLTPIQTVFQVTIPRLIEYTIDYVKTNEVSSGWLPQKLSEYGTKFEISNEAVFALAMISFGLISNLLYAFVQSHRAWMNIRLEWLFRQKAFDGITAKGPDFFTRFRTGDLVTRMTDDVAEKLSWFACSGIFRTYEAMIMIAFALAMMISIDPMLTLWTAGPLPILIIIFFKSASILDKRYDHLQTRISKFNDIMEACLSGIRVVKAYVREDPQKRKFDEAAYDRRSAEISVVKAMTIVESLYMYIWQVGIVIVLLAGGYMVMNANLSLGKLVAFIYYVVYLIFPMFDIGQFLVKSRQSAVSIDRLMELEKVPPMVTDAENGDATDKIRGELSFEKTTLGFRGSDRKIVNNISLDIRPGMTIALVGKVGSGKTWLVNMIPRLVDPSGGTIKLDGRDLKEFKLNDLRRNIGFVPQEPTLFSDTIRNNIVFGRDNISNETIDWAVDISQLKSEIDSFPKGLETPIGTRGMSISGGQKQRLALARALVGRPKILILDDCTSALDSRTETALWDRLHEVLPDLTAILITHRPDTLEKVDNIYVLEDGQVIESGNHYQLMENGGHYARIYRRFRLEEAVS